VGDLTTAARRIVFVTHSGPGIGLGHLRRCLTLAEALAEQGAGVAFILGVDTAGAAMVRARGFRAEPCGHGPGPVLEMLRPMSPDVVVADSYELTAADLLAYRQTAPVAVLDDVGDRALPVDLLWNGGIHARSLDYATRTGGRARLLLGTEYALLAREYRRLPDRVIGSTAEKVLITVGGADPSGSLTRLLQATSRALPAATLDVVLGPYVPRPARPLSVGPDRVRFHEALPSLLAVMQAADLAVSAGGQTIYELAATATPTVAVWLAENQRAQVEEFARRGTLWAAGGVGGPEPIEERVTELVMRLAADVDARRAMSAAGRGCLDGHGASRTASAILELC
jgi:UDP-2,4-diacetamido-2,4,6-trideoxy-beta-L-altropyranose hydrolase